MEYEVRIREWSSEVWSSDLVFLFLGGRGGVDVGDRRVGQLLDLGIRPLAIILADCLFILVLLQIVHAVAADVADGDARLFGILARELGQLLAALLRHFGDRQAEPQIGRAACGDRGWQYGEISVVAVSLK